MKKIEPEESIRPIKSMADQMKKSIGRGREDYEDTSTGSEFDKVSKRVDKFALWIYNSRSP
jgi:hypothetical protein